MKNNNERCETIEISTDTIEIEYAPESERTTPGRYVFDPSLGRFYIERVAQQDQ